MMEDYNTKDMGVSGEKPAEQPKEKITMRAVSRIKNAYHFPGSGIWKAIEIIASTIEEATEVWLQKREPVNPEKKIVEETKPTNE
jgi:hypothetical protein